MATLDSPTGGRLDEQQKLWLGGAGLVVGVALILLLGFGPFDSNVVQLVLALVGVVTIVGGTLLVGTSQRTV